MYAGIIIGLLVVGAPTYFGLRWFLRTYMKDVQLRKRLTWIGTIVLTPVIYAGWAALFFTVLSYIPKRDFDKEKWMTDRDKRYEMWDDLVNSDLLKNKRKDEVIDLLGHPGTARDTTNNWRYSLGGFGFEINSLIITFENERVIKAEKIYEGDM